jgi:multidrug efflux system membrane fusion protein
MLSNKPQSLDEDTEHDPDVSGGSGINNSSKRPLVLFIIAIAVLALGAFLYNHFKSGLEVKKVPTKALPITIATVDQKSVPVEINVIGTVQPFQTVAMKSQVVGQLMKVHFKQGDFVKKGDLLFTIDARSATAQVDQAKAVEAKDRAQVRQAQANVFKDAALIKQAEAVLAKDRSSLALARKEEKRYATLVEQGVVSHEQFDQQKTTEETMESTVAADEALLGSAKASMQADQALTSSLESQRQADEAAASNSQVYLSYTNIRSPIDGRTGSLNIHEGNLIKDNDVTSLISIDQISPIYVNFAVPEQYLGELTRYNSAAALKVTATIEGSGHPENGVVSFIDNAVDSSTGTINLKATFENKDKQLWPGQFVNVMVVLKDEPNTLLVPSQAVQSGQDGQFVFVVKFDSTVEQRTVKMTRTVNGFAVIKQGLHKGETIVTDGQMQLTPGCLVEPKKSIVDVD